MITPLYANPVHTPQPHQHTAVQLHTYALLHCLPMPMPRVLPQDTWFPNLPYGLLNYLLLYLILQGFLHWTVPYSTLPFCPYLWPPYGPPATGTPSSCSTAPVCSLAGFTALYL